MKIILTAKDVDLFVSCIMYQYLEHMMTKYLLVREFEGLFVFNVLCVPFIQ